MKHTENHESNKCYRLKVHLYTHTMNEKDKLSAYGHETYTNGVDFQISIILISVNFIKNGIGILLWRE